METRDAKRQHSAQQLLRVLVALVGIGFVDHGRRLFPRLKVQRAALTVIRGRRRGLFEAVVAQLVRYLFGVNTLFGTALFKSQRERGAISSSLLQPHSLVSGCSCAVSVCRWCRLGLFGCRAIGDSRS